MIVDASVWISILSDTELHHPASRRWFRARAANSDDLVIPSLAIVEVAGAIARRLASTELAWQAMDWILQLPSLQQVPLSERLALQAADIAATHRLRGADAVYVAVAEEFEMPLVTWDAELLDRAASIIDVIHP